MSVATTVTMLLNMRPIDVARDGVLMIAYAKDLFAISFGTPRKFVEQFGDDGAAYLHWINEKQVIAPANAALVLVGSEPVGMVVVGPWPEDLSVGYVYHCYLQPNARGLGLATALDAYAAERLTCCEHRKARLSVDKTNDRALRFYRKHGWLDVGPRPDQPGIMYMQKALASDVSV